MYASTEHEIDAEFSSLAQVHAGAMQVAADPFFFSRRDYIAVLAARHRIPAIYENREFARSRGPNELRTNFLESYRQAGIYTGRILKGEKPTDLP